MHSFMGSASAQNKSLISDPAKVGSTSSILPGHFHISLGQGYWSLTCRDDMTCYDDMA